MHGSCRPWITSVVFSIRERLTEFCWREMDGVGLNAARNTTGIPVEIPPRMPPQLFVSVTIRPSCTRNASLCSLPRSRAAAKPAPNSTPLTAGMANTARAIRFSSPPNIGSPMPAGKPSTTHSTTPPTESPSAFACAISACMAAAASSETAGNGFSATGASNGALSVACPMDKMRARMEMPSRSSSCIQTPPAMHSGAVSRPEKCPPPLTSCAPPNLTCAV